MAESYTKAKLIAELAGGTSFSKAAVGRLLDRLTEIAYREAANGFVVPGVCKLKVVQKKASRRRNPITGKVFLIGERKGLKIVPLKKAKLAIVPNTDVVVQMLEEAPPPVTAQESAPAPETAGGVPAPTPSVPAPAPAAAAATPQASLPPATGDDGQIVFTCSECGSMLAAPPKMAGQMGECPFCNAKTQIPERQPEAAKAEKMVVGGEKTAPALTDFILFVCRACGQEIEAPADMVGMNVECPTCATSLTVPIASTAASAESADGQPKGDQEEAGKNRSSMTIRIDLSDLE